MGQFALGGGERGGAVGPLRGSVLRVGFMGRWWGRTLAVGGGSEGRGRVVGGDVAEGGVELGC